MSSKNVILIYPPAIFKDPQIIEATRGLRSPITIEHSLTKCERCGEDGWIGPRQRATAAAGGGEVVCLYCFLKDRALQDRIRGVITLNPDIENVPRRNG